jgi:hypothetical protein
MKFMHYFNQNENGRNDFLNLGALISSVLALISSMAPLFSSLTLAMPSEQLLIMIKGTAVDHAVPFS